MILTESWVRTKLRYWSILHLSIYIIGLVALITIIQDVHGEFFGEFLTIIFSIWGGFLIFLVLTEICNLAGLSYRNTCLITFWQVVFIILIGLISIAAVIGLIIQITGLVDEVITAFTVITIGSIIFAYLDERLGHNLDHCNSLWFMWGYFNWIFVFVVLLNRTSNLDLNIERIDC